ncbi:MAG: serine/threonine protein kinase, partial [Planctomycetaceae bacterium]|nr:serine/threonine protein kinase [Planctomycetaceae bacterium]
ELSSIIKRLRKNDPSAQQAYPISRLVDICIKVCEGVAFAHSRGVIHRDIKPANILVTPAGEPRIADFGMAKRENAVSTIGGDGAIIGTMAYMSPEQASGNASHVDGRTDIYAVGSILYELLTGQRVFRGNARELATQILYSTPEPLRTKVPQLSPDLEQVCLKCLQKLPEDRYASAAELADDLHRFIQGLPVTAHPLPRRIRLVRWMSRHRLAVAATAGLSALAAGLTFLMAHAPQQVPPPLPVPKTVHLLTEPPGALMTLFPCDPITGLPEKSRTIFSPTPTPTTLELLPGRYCLLASPKDNPGMFAEVYRVVPEPGGHLPVMGRQTAYRTLSANEIEWRPVPLPPPGVNDGMVLIDNPGEVRLTVGRESCTVSLAPF